MFFQIDSVLFKVTNHLCGFSRMAFFHPLHVAHKLIALDYHPFTHESLHNLWIMFCQEKA